MKPLVERLTTAYKGKVDFRVYVDSGDPVGDQIAQQLDIQYVPSFVFVNTDGSLSGRMIVGGTDETTLRQRIDTLK
jgi:thioredoxin-like negative regulator of GroEL